MTTQTAAPPLGHTLDISSTRPVPFGRLVRVELRKSYDTRAGMWLLLTIVLLTLVVEGIVLAVTTVQDEPMNFGDFVGAAAFVTSVLLPVLGHHAGDQRVGPAHGDGDLRAGAPASAGDPGQARHGPGADRWLTAAFAITVGLVCNLLYAAIQGQSPSWEFGFNFLVGFLITQSFAMLGGFALAALLLNTAGGDRGVLRLQVGAARAVRARARR